MLDNAIKYSKPESVIIISVTEYELYLAISVKDQGIGIREENLSQIFGRFYRSEEVSQEEGVGIGLYLIHIQERLNKIIESHGYSTEEGDENYIASNANWAYISDGAEQDSITVGAVAGGLLLIILTGYLIIYNIFQISVIRDIRYYGLLKTIGTTGKQIKKILRRQALILGLLGIPLGLIGGFILGKAVVPKFLELSSYTVDQVTVSMNPWIFVGAAVFTLLTVWISAGKPARMAARVSPVEAVRYTEGYQDKRKSKKSTDGGKLWKMALSNLGRNKRKTILVLFSLSLSVILLNSVFTITHSFNMDKL